MKFMFWLLIFVAIVSLVCAAFIYNAEQTPKGARLVDDAVYTWWHLPPEANVVFHRRGAANQQDGYLHTSADDGTSWEWFNSEDSDVIQWSGTDARRPIVDRTKDR